MEQSPWEANRFLGSQEIPRISWNPNVHYRGHNSLPLVPILSQINQVHVISFLVSKIHSNINLASNVYLFHVDSLPQVSVIHPTCHMCRPSHPPWFEHLSKIWWGVNPWNSLYIFLQPTCYVINVFSQALMLCSSSNIRNQVLPTYEITGKITPHSSYILLSLILPFVIKKYNY